MKKITVVLLCVLMLIGTSVTASADMYEYAENAGAEHTFSIKYDENGHWLECSHCGDKSETESHSYGDTGVCIECGYQKNETVVPDGTTEPEAEAIGSLSLAIVLFAVAGGWLILAGVQWAEKGFLLNNAYLYASKEERANMNKTPYFRQSAVVFLMVGVAFALDGVNALLLTGWMTWVAIGLMAATVIFAVVSRMVIRKKYR